MCRSFRLSLTRLSVEVLIIANTASKMKVTMLPLLAVTGLRQQTGAFFASSEAASLSD